MARNRGAETNCKIEPLYIPRYRSSNNISAIHSGHPRRRAQPNDSTVLRTSVSLVLCDPPARDDPALLSIIARFFPGARDELAAIDEEIVRGASARRAGRRIASRISISLGGHCTSDYGTVASSPTCAFD